MRFFKIIFQVRILKIPRGAFSVIYSIWFWQMLYWATWGLTVSAKLVYQGYKIFRINNPHYFSGLTHPAGYAIIPVDLLQAKPFVFVVVRPRICFNVTCESAKKKETLMFKEG